MDRLFRQSARDVAALSPLDRLAFIGSRAMGALTFEPADPLELPADDVKLLALAQQTQAVMADQGVQKPKALALMGGSPHGARPKVLVYFEPVSGQMNTRPFDGSSAWLVKFPARGEHKEVCAIENLYAELARGLGLDTPATRYFELDAKLAAFGIERFDTERGLRVPMHTLAGLLHADFRLPSAVDCATFLRATRFLTRSQVEVNKAYERLVFNNRDDHAKNLSSRLGEDRAWRLAPAYDLTYNEGPGGEHQMDVCGEGRHVSRAKMMELARHGDVGTGFAQASLDKALALVDELPDRAHAHAIRAATLRTIRGAVVRNREHLR